MLSSITPAIIIFLIYSLAVLLSCKVIKWLRNKGRLSEKVNDYANLITLYALAIFFIIFAIAFGPLLIELMGYEISDKGSITNSDAISWVLDSVLAVLLIDITFKGAIDQSTSRNNE